MKFLSLTTLRELARLSLPMVVSQGTFAVMIFTDRWFLSSLSSAHIAAALGGGVAAMFCMSFFSGLISYANALVAQYHGAGKMERCTKVVTQGFYLTLATVPVFATVALLAGGLFARLGHDPSLVPLERAYFYTLMAGGPLMVGKTLLACYFVGIGRSRVVMLVDVVGIVVNIPLTWALIFGKFGLPELGIVGAGIGTVTAQGLAIVLFLFFYFERAHVSQFAVKRSWGYEPGVMKRFLRLGLPSAMEAFMNTATFNVFLLMFQSYGVAEGAAMAIVFNWDMLSFVPMIGLSIGVTTLIGRSVGAGEIDRANQMISSGFIMALGYSGTLAVLFFIFRVELIDVFSTPDDDFQRVRELGQAMIVGLCSYMLADATILISGGALRGAGDTRWVMITSTSLHMAMLVAQYFVIVQWQMSPLVSWWVFVTMLISIAICFVARLGGGRWRRPERLARVMAEH
ncbi:MATE family efflux transporter [Halioglobus maricola]|uniref:Multidrug-efflux transporter n=1 Tax=Halioglobus maricola TaxID=2601894 RepID=A0A5P9NJ40_9GAMM|nr:MATE family efflux transporter [Halioglobus maricola]QFU75851.1 MATE family efflux transporter [Halioglobus maricola]